MKIDFIGDTHGHANELALLLFKLGYDNINGYFSHPQGRKVVFVGDFIDRGPQIRETLQIVKGMCDNKIADTVMGNHEYNAILFHTKNKKKGGYYRKHGFKEIKQHLETLRQFQYYTYEWEMYVEWFKSLPLFIETEYYRVVHAYWNTEHIEYLKNNPIEWDDNCYDKVTKKDSLEHILLEELLKGKEYKLPDGYHFYDKDNIKRNECRVKWWQPINNVFTYGDYLLHCPESLKYKKLELTLEKAPIDKPIFFGHYWLREDELKLSNLKTICLDYSVAKNGHLVAYSLDTKKFTIQKSIS